MELEFKADFDQARQNWKRMWEGTLGRPALMITIPKEGVEPVQKPGWGAARTMASGDLCDQVLRWAETHEFLGEAVPAHPPSLIEGIHAALMGAEIEVMHESWGVDTHVVPFVEDLNEVEGRLLRDSVWWEKWVSLLETSRCKFAGRLVFGEGFVGENLDILSAIRGPTEFLFDLMDDPDGVHHAMREIQKVCEEFHSENAKILEYDKYGSVTRHGFYSDGITGVPQSDAAFSIGKEHFDEFALPYLKQEIARLDNVEYHLDGRGNITHLDSICGIDAIGLIQWVAGVGEDAQLDWSDLYEQITERGKGLWLGADTPEQALGLWEKYGSRSGRMALTCHAENRAEAERYFETFGL